MCMKLHPEYLNSGPFSSHLTNTYTCRMIIALRVCGGVSYIIIPKLTYTIFTSVKKKK